MAKEIAFENSRITNFVGLVTLTSDRVILHRPLPTSQISLKSKKIFVDGQTDARTYVRMHGRTDGVDLKSVS